MKKALIVIGSVILGAVILFGLMFIPNVDKFVDDSKDKIKDVVTKEEQTEDSATKDEQTQEGETQEEVITIKNLPAQYRG